MMAEKTEKSNVQVRSAAPLEPNEETFSPLVDIYEDEEGTTVLMAEVPGATVEKVDVRVDKGVLTLYADGRLPEMGPDYGRTYRGFTGGQYFRAFALGDGVDRDRIGASLSDGVLTLTMPRAAAARTRKIEISTD